MISQTPSISSDGGDVSALRRAGKADSPEALRSAARQFEGLFMNMVMKSMREATSQDSPFDSQQSRMYTSMLDQKVSDKFAQRCNVIRSISLSKAASRTPRREP